MMKGILPLAGMGRFLRWWTDELAGLWPAGRRWRSAAGGEGAMVAVWGAGQVSLWQRTAAGRCLLVAQAAPGGTEAARLSKALQASPGAGRLALRLAAELPLRRSLTLPRAAAPYLRQVVANDMDRRTPWRADQVYFHAAARPGAAEEALLTVDLTLLPRRTVQPALDALATLGLRPDCLELATDALGPDGAPLGPAPRVPLAEGTGRPEARLPLWPAAVFLAAVTLAAVSLAAGQLRLAELRHAAEGARRGAAAAHRLADDLMRRQRHLRFPLARKAEHPAAVLVLEALSRLLPDDCWLVGLDLSGEALRLSGNASDAARLLPLLQDSGRFAEVQFAAPLLREGGVDRFQISARVVPHAAP